MLLRTVEIVSLIIVVVLFKPAVVSFSREVVLLRRLVCATKSVTVLRRSLVIIVSLRFVVEIISTILFASVEFSFKNSTKLLVLSVLDRLERNLSTTTIEVLVLLVNAFTTLVDDFRREVRLNEGRIILNANVLFFLIVPMR